jgi:DNA-binding PadR family transcriptional regulator
MDDELVAGLAQEVRRGTVVVACLAALRESRYGYRLIDDLAEAGIAVGADTLYPLLRRLEKHGLLDSAWNTDEPRPRKFYVTTDNGRAVLAALMAEWQALDTALRAIARDDANDDSRGDSR